MAAFFPLVIRQLALAERTSDRISSELEHEGVAIHLDEILAFERVGYLTELGVIEARVRHHISVPNFETTDLGQLVCHGE